jgi:selenocysteine lyase/cysteine desulfurase
VYLDYTGGGLFAASQLHEHVRLLESTVLGNPHSINPTSAASTELLERARTCVLEFFNASPDEYAAIFTPNATGALRLVGEAYPFHAGDRFLLIFDNHNSVSGIREFAHARGAVPTYVPSIAPDLRVDPSLLRRYLRHNRTSPASSTRWTGSSRRTRTAGTFCSTRPRTCRRIGSTSPAGRPTTGRCRSTRCSAGRRASAA